MFATACTDVDAGVAVVRNVSWKMARPSPTRVCCRSALTGQDLNLSLSSALGGIRVLIR